MAVLRCCKERHAVKKHHEGKYDHVDKWNYQMAYRVGE